MKKRFIKRRAALIMSAVMLLTFTPPVCAADINAMSAINNNSDVNARTASIASLTMNTPPTTLQYFTGEKFNPAGGVVTVSYSDNTTKDISLSDCEVGGIDTSKAGSYSAKVTYGGVSLADAFVVEVKDSSVVYAVLSSPTKIFYIEGQSLDISGGSWEITYDDGHTESKPLTLSECSGYNLSLIGEQTVCATLTGTDKTGTFTVSISKKRVESISVSTIPAPLTFIEGTAFVCNDGKVTLNYDNGTEETIDLTSDMCSGYDMNKVGTQKVTVTYSGFTTTYDIAIRAKKVTKIVMNTNPTKVDYVEGQTLYTVGGTFDVTYDNNTTDTGVSLSEAACTADMNQIGDQNVRVVYEGSETSYPITIVKKQITAIKLDQKPTKVNYVAGIDTALDVTGGKLAVSYDNGKTVSMDVKTEWCTGFDAAKLGSQTITITYTEDGITKTVSYDITMKKVLTSIKWKNEPKKKNFAQGEKFTVDGTIIPVYSDKSEDKGVDVTTAMCSGQNTKVSGEQTVTVTYEGKEVTYTITVDGIVTETAPTKLEYVKGEALELNGLTFQFYLNGTMVKLPWDAATMSVTGYNANVAGVQSLTITYTDPKTGKEYVLKDAVKVTVKNPTDSSTNNGSSDGTTKMNKTTNSKTAAPKTGDGWGVKTAVLQLCVSALAVCAVFLYKRKRQC